MRLAAASLFVTYLTSFAAAPLFEEDFESMGETGKVPGDWRHFTAVRTVAPDAEFVHGGRFALKLVDEDGKQAVGLRSPRIPVEAGRRYVATCWYRGEKGNNQAVYLEFWNTAGKRVDATSFGCLGRGTWRRVVARAVAPEGSAGLTVHFNSYSTNKATGWFDDLAVHASTFMSTLARKPYPPAPVVHPCGLYKSADVARAKENVERHAWARKLLAGMEKRARFWLDMPEDDLPYWIPELTPFRVVDCPDCGAGWRFAWSGDTDKLVCRKCAFTWPHPDYPESESHTFPTPVGGEQTIPHYKGKPSTVYGSAKSEVYRLSGHLRLRRLGKLGSVGDLGKVYALTGERDHAERARMVLLRLAEVYPHYLAHDWNRVYKDYSNLQSGKLSGWKLSDAGVFIQLATAYDLTYNSGVYTDEDKVHIEEGCFREFARLMTATSPRGCCINDGPTAMGGGALAGLMIGSHEAVAWAIEPPDGFLGFLEEYFVRDGHWYEASPSYEGMSVNPLYVTPEALRGYSDPPAYADEDRYDDLDLLQHPLMRKLMIAGVSEVMPDGCLPPTNDSTWRARFAGRRAAVHAYWYPSEASNRLLSWAYGGALDERGDEYALFRRDPQISDQTVSPATPSASSVVRPGVGWAILRTGATRDDAAVFLDYGPKGSGHGHPDRLNIIYYDYGRELVTDLGYLGWGHPNHPWIRSTASHNHVIVDGKPHGAAGGELEAFSGFGPVQGSIASAPRTYPETTTVFRRHLVFVDHGPGHRYLVDLFEVEGGTDHQYAFHGDGEAFKAPDLPFEPIDGGTLGEPAAGYAHLREIEAAPVDEAFLCEWVSDAREHVGVRLHMMGREGTSLVTARANGLRNRSAPFAEVAMSPIFVRRAGPANRFLAVVEAFRGDSDAPVRVRKVPVQAAAGWAEAVEVAQPGRSDIVVVASAEAAAAGIRLPELPQVRCHARLAFVGRREGAVDQLWALGGKGVAVGDAELEIVQPAAGRVTEVDDEGDAARLEARVDGAWRGRDRQLLITGESDGAYAVSDASRADTGTRLALAEEPIVGFGAGAPFAVVPSGSMERVAPHALRLRGSVRALRLRAPENVRLFARDEGSDAWREVPGGVRDGHVSVAANVLAQSGDTWLVWDTASPADDSGPPVLEGVRDESGERLPYPDTGYRPGLRDVVFEFSEAGELSAGQVSVSLHGARSGDLPVTTEVEGGEGRWRVAASVPAELGEDAYTLGLSVVDRALNRTTCELQFNTIGVVRPFRDLEVSGSSGLVVKYFSGLDTRFYRSVKPGDWVAFDFDVPDAGAYDVELVYTFFDAYGIVQAAVDGTPVGDPVDLYGKELNAGGGVAGLGRLELAAGGHVFRLDVTGRNPASSNCFIGVCELRLKPCGE